LPITIFKTKNREGNVTMTLGEWREQTKDVPDDYELQDYFEEPIDEIEVDNDNKTIIIYTEGD